MLKLIVLSQKNEIGLSIERLDLSMDFGLNIIPDNKSAPVGKGMKFTGSLDSG